LKSVFLPKIARLRLATAEGADEASAAILVLTRGSGRVAALRAALDAADSVPVLVQELPHDPGRARLRALRNVFAGAASS
jgi:hypothetical protein